MSFFASAAEWFFEHVIVVEHMWIVLFVLGASFAFLAWRRPRVGIIVTYNVVASLILLDLLLVLPLRFPVLLPLVPRAALGIERENYMNNWRTFFQMQHDPELSSILRREPFHFQNPEFDTIVQGNSRGLRDDETSLIDPAILILGDSHAMGWGVQQDETFAQLVESGSGLRVLNAGINGFGTVREAMLWERLVSPSLRYVIIQHCDNDERENALFERLGYLPIAPPGEREKVTREAAAQIRYIPLKLALVTLRHAVRDMKRSIQQHFLGTHLPPVLSATEEVAQFLHALTAAGPSLPLSLRIIVLETNGFNKNDSIFVRAVESAARSPALPSALRKLRTLDTSSFLTDKDYFVLDDHINRSGHRRIAEEVLRLLASDGVAVHSTAVVTFSGSSESKRR